MTQMEGTTLEIPTQGLARTLPLHCPEMDRCLLHEIFTQKRVTSHPIDDFHQTWIYRRLVSPQSAVLDLVGLNIWTALSMLDRQSVGVGYHGWSSFVFLSV